MGASPKFVVGILLVLCVKEYVNGEQHLQTSSINTVSTEKRHQLKRALPATIENSQDKDLLALTFQFPKPQVTLKHPKENFKRESKFLTLDEIESATPTSSIHRKSSKKKRRNATSHLKRHKTVKIDPHPTEGVYQEPEGKENLPSSHFEIGKVEARTKNNYTEIDLNRTRSESQLNFKEINKTTTESESSLYNDNITQQKLSQGTPKNNTNRIDLSNNSNKSIEVVLPKSTTKLVKKASTVKSSRRKISKKLKRNKHKSKKRSGKRKKSNHRKSHSSHKKHKSKHRRNQLTPGPSEENVMYYHRTLLVPFEALQYPDYKKTKLQKYHDNLQQRFHGHNEPSVQYDPETGAWTFDNLLNKEESAFGDGNDHDDYHPYDSFEQIPINQDNIEQNNAGSSDNNAESHTDNQIKEDGDVEGSLNGTGTSTVSSNHVDFEHPEGHNGEEDYSKPVDQHETENKPIESEIEIPEDDYGVDRPISSEQDEIKEPEDDDEAERPTSNEQDEIKEPEEDDEADRPTSNEQDNVDTDDHRKTTEHEKETTSIRPQVDNTSSVGQNNQEANVPAVGTIPNNSQKPETSNIAKPVTTNVADEDLPISEETENQSPDIEEVPIDDYDEDDEEDEDDEYYPTLFDGYDPYESEEPDEEDGNDDDNDDNDDDNDDDDADFLTSTADAFDFEDYIDSYDDEDSVEKPAEDANSKNKTQATKQQPEEIDPNVAPSSDEAAWNRYSSIDANPDEIIDDRQTGISAEDIVSHEASLYDKLDHRSSLLTTGEYFRSPSTYDSTYESEYERSAPSVNFAQNYEYYSEYRAPRELGSSKRRKRSKWRKKRQRSKNYKPMHNSERG